MARRSSISPAQMDARRAALIALMDRCCNEIRELELACGLPVGRNDLRPRIEYFHDAVRTITEHPEAMHQPRTRLSLEWLAFDLATLRQIQEKPLTRIDLRHVMGSGQETPGSALQPSGAPAPQQRAALAEQYRTYTVFFAALFAEAVDRNFHTRLDRMNQEVEDIAQVEQALKLLEQGKGRVTEAQVENMILQLENDRVRGELMALLHRQAMQKRERLQAARMFAQAAMQGIDRDIAALDKQHMAFLSDQMMLMHASKDLVRRLSGQGLNLAGKFLEAAFSAAGLGRSR